MRNKLYDFKTGLKGYYAGAALIALVGNTSNSFAMQNGEAVDPVIIPQLRISSSPSDQAGGNATPVKLVKKKLKNISTGKEKECFQFVGMDDNPISYKGSIAPFYDKEELIQHLRSTEKVYNDAIEQLQQKAYRALKPILKEHIHESSIETLLANYLSKSNTEKEINITGSPLSDGERKELKDYMKLCEAVYTDFYTRDFLTQQNLPTVMSQCNKIIDKRKEVQRLRGLILGTRDMRDRARNEINPIFVGKPGKNVSAVQAESIENAALILQSNDNYKEYIKELNESFFRAEPISYNAVFEEVKRKLDDLQVEIDSEYLWYFGPDPEMKNWLQKLFISKTSQIPVFTDIDGKKHQLTNKAVISSSFLSKAELGTDDTITVLDVGFRNQEQYGSFLNEFATMAADRVKRNPKAWFEKAGEVDHIAYIKKDPENKKDKLFLVYSGSNSALDWGINGTMGNTGFYGLSVHEGIGWLFDASIKTFHNVLMARIKYYYKSNRHPDELEIITTGHSLGGALAELCAYYYKAQQIDKFQNIIPRSRISVKAFTFGTPAIVDKMSKNNIEKTLGENNILRVWTFNDPVVNWTENAPIQCGAHVGRSVPLYNIQNLTFNFLDWWGAHGATRYKSYLHTLQPENYPDEFNYFTIILNNYIKANHLDIYKVNRRKLQRIIEEFKTENTPNSLELHQGLAEHIIKYSPRTVNLKPYTTVREIEVHSPRYAAALSPRFVVEGDPVSATGNWIDDRYEVKATFKIESNEIDFPIVKSTDCSIPNIQKFLSERSITLEEKSAEKLSCGSYMAKHIFVSQEMDYPSNYTGEWGIIFTLHQDTLTKMLSSCVKERICSAEYLDSTSKGNNTLGQVTKILQEVGLAEAFQKKKVHFRRFEKQDHLADKKARPGIDIAAQYKAPEIMLDREYLKFLIENPSNQVVQFANKSLRDPNNIFRKVIETTTYRDHYNRLNAHLNTTELIKLLLEYDEQSAENKFDNFVNNLKNRLKAFFKQSRQEKDCGWLPAINQNNLNEDLKRLKRSILDCANWKIQEKDIS